MLGLYPPIFGVVECILCLIAVSLKEVMVYWKRFHWHRELNFTLVGRTFFRKGSRWFTSKLWWDTEVCWKRPYCNCTCPSRIWIWHFYSFLLPKVWNQWGNWCKDMWIYPLVWLIQNTTIGVNATAYCCHLLLRHFMSVHN